MSTSAKQRVLRSENRPIQAIIVIFMLIAASFVGTSPALASPSVTNPDRILLGEAQMTFVPDQSDPNLIQPLGKATGNCGTSSIYLTVPSRGKAVVTWSMFSTKGIMFSRNLTINHGPAISGQIIDSGLLGRMDYSKSRTWTGLRGNFGASLHGSVTVLGGTCILTSTYTTTYTFK